MPETPPRTDMAEAHILVDVMGLRHSNESDRRFRLNGLFFGLIILLILL